MCATGQAHFRIDMDGAEAGRQRGAGDFAFGPVANVSPGKNVFSVFRYSTRHAQALKILGKRYPTSNPRSVVGP